jgi:hypothetical protein
MTEELDPKNVFVVRPAPSGASMVNDRGVWVHQGKPVEDLDFMKVLREERLKQSGRME